MAPSLNKFPRLMTWGRVVLSIVTTAVCLGLATHFGAPPALTWVLRLGSRSIKPPTVSPLTSQIWTIDAVLLAVPIGFRIARPT